MNKSLIRFFDVLFSFSGLIILSPFLLFFSLLILLDSRGGIFYRQVRVGRNNRDFMLWKFRTMKTGADKSGFITIGEKDPRITRIGYFLRRYKLDELPQLLNVLSAKMSMVGPRPEVRKYVNLYSPEQMKVLEVKPGITDLASIEYANENELLGKSEIPDKTYVEEIMPAKLKLNMEFIQRPTLKNYFRIIFKTLRKIL